MFRLRLAAATAQKPHGLPQRHALRHIGYCPSAWNAFSSASLSRYFHCTLKESLQREQDGLSAVAPSSTSTSTHAHTTGAALTCAKRQASGDARVAHADDAASTPPSSASSSAVFSAPPRKRLRTGKSPCALLYSLELSLPHLPHRSPFVEGACPSLAGLNHTSTSGEASPGAADSGRASLVTALLPPSLNNSVSGKASAVQGEGETKHGGEASGLLQPKWVDFVRLCDAIAKADAAAARNAASPASSPHLTGLTIPCKEPYFCSSGREEKEHDAATASYPLSTIQAAVLLFHQHWHIPVTLALNTTVANRDNNNSLLSNTATAAGQPRSAVSGATAAGIHAVVQDFVQRLGGRQVLLVRGDSPATQHGIPTGAATTPAASPDVAHTAAAATTSLSTPLSTATTNLNSASSASSAAAGSFPAELHTSGDLVCCVRDALQSPDVLASLAASAPGAKVKIVVAGYPQGHPLERQWKLTPAASTTTTTTAAAADGRSAATTAASSLATVSAALADATGSSTPTTPSSAFFDKFERDFNAADRLFERVVATHVPAAPLPALHYLFHTLGRLHAVRQLWLTPSTYPAEARAASARRLVEEKILAACRSSGKSGEGDRMSNAAAAAATGGSGGACVVVTQMLTSAPELMQFTNDVQRALRMYASPSPSSPPVSVKVIPGILLPHPTDAHILLRSLYYAKVIPSARLQRALETYRTDLKSVWRSIVTHNNTTEEEGEQQGVKSASHGQDMADGYMSTWPGRVILHNEEEVAAIESFVHDAHRRAASRFAAAWMKETVDLLSEVRQCNGEQNPVHFFTMFNDQVDVRLAQLLEAYAVKQEKQQQRASMCM